MVRALATSVALAAALAGCAPQADCTLTVWVRRAHSTAEAHADFSQAELIGSWDGWARPGVKEFVSRRSSDGTEWMGATLALPEGEYQYAILLGDTLLLDEANPRSAFVTDPLRAGAEPYATEVSVVELFSAATPRIIEVELAPQGSGALVLTAHLASQAEATPALTVEVRRGSEQVAAPALAVSREEGGFVVRGELAALPPGKYTATLRAADGSLSPASASAFVEAVPAAAPRELADGLVYQVMVDRFRGAGPLAPPPTPGSRAGGTLDGVRAALEAGYFERLGVTTLWLSPVYQNPEGLYLGRDGRGYESYHGYWPTDPRAVDPRLGGEQALDALVAAAHARGVRVILDAVPNHVFSTHPYFRDHGRGAAGQGSWFNDGPEACVCGSESCGWGEKIETCWFTDYLPDLNLRLPEVVAQAGADLAWWMDRFDLDGLRLDAVPMMPRPATRAMARAVRGGASRQGLDGLLLGEVYTGPGAGGRAEIRAYLGARVDGLDSAFDFPLMWAMRDVIARGASGFDALERELAEGDLAWEGSGSTIARIIGNHDTTRFLSEAVGDAGRDGWVDPARQPTEEEPYRRQLLALAYSLTLRGLPVLYYGDEVGLAGGGDPDSRRVMPDVLGALPGPQAQLLDQVGRLGRARLAVPALRQGPRKLLWADADREVVVRRAPAGAEGDAVVVLSRAASESTREIAGLPSGTYRDVLSERRLQVVDGVATLTFPALSAAVYVAEGALAQP